MMKKPLSIVKNISIPIRNIDTVEKYCKKVNRCSDCVIQNYAINNDMYIRPCYKIVKKYEEELEKIERLKEILS